MYIFLNGWASNAAVWGDLPERTGGICYDLAAENALSEYRHRFSLLLEEQPQVTLVAWSLGGMLALDVASLFPERIKRLVLLSSTAKFAADVCYSHGMAPAIIRQLARKVQRDPAAAQKKFYPLMFSAQEAPWYDVFQKTMERQVLATNVSFLQQGLSFLATQDMRSRLSGIRVQTQIVHGREDTICPFGAAEYLAAHLPNAELIELPGCGHIPFFTQEKICREVIFRPKGD